MQDLNLLAIHTIQTHCSTYLLPLSNSGNITATTSQSSDANIPAIPKRKVLKKLWCLPTIFTFLPTKHGERVFLQTTLRWPFWTAAKPQFGVLATVYCTVYTHRHIHIHMHTFINLVMISPLNTPIWQLQDQYRKLMIFPKLPDLVRDFIYLTTVIVINTRLHQHVRYLG